MDERIAVCRLGGKVRAFHDLCIHRGCPISLGWVEGEEIVCAYHGWSYDAGGKCTRIPSVPPEHPIPKKACLTPYLCDEKYGIIWVCMGETPRAPSRTSSIRPTSPGCTTAFWPTAKIRSPRTSTSKETAKPSCFKREDLPTKFHVAAHIRNYRLTRPFTIYQRKEEADGKAECFYFVVQPHSANNTTWYFLIARNFDPKALGIEGEEKFYRTILEQDRQIIEEQRPEELPLDLTEELHVKGPDGVALAYRRIMRELGVE